MLVRGCHAPVLCTPGDGRSASQGTDLPRAVGEKRRQRHFGILWRSAQSRKLGCVFACRTRSCLCFAPVKIRIVRAEGPPILVYRKKPKVRKKKANKSSPCRESRHGEAVIDRTQLFLAPRDLAIFAAPSVMVLVPSGKSQMASTPSRDSTNARDSSYGIRYAAVESMSA